MSALTAGAIACSYVLNIAFSDLFETDGALDPIWTVHSGAVSRTGGSAVFSGTAGNTQIATVLAGTQANGLCDVELEAPIAAARGAALYPRFVDTSNWVRVLAQYDYTTSYYYVTEYQYSRTYQTAAASPNAWTQTSQSGACMPSSWGNSSSESGNSYGYTTSRVDVSSVQNSFTCPNAGSPWLITTTNYSRTINPPTYATDYMWSSSNPGGDWSATGSTRQVGPYPSDNPKPGRIVIQKMVAGALSTVATYDSGSDTGFTFKVRAQGSTITAYRNGTSVLTGTVSDFQSTGVRAGIGAGPSPWTASNPSFASFSLVGIG